jgi:hypothetical protein
MKKEMIDIDGIEYELQMVKEAIEMVEYIKEKSGDSLVLQPEPKEEKKEFVIEYDNPWFTNKNREIKRFANGLFIPLKMLEFGELRKTKQNAEYSKKRNQRADLLEALVEELQGELGVGDYEEIAYKGDKYLQKMKYETFIKICEMLNNEEYSLEG